MLSDRCPVCLSFPVYDDVVLWPNGWMNQDETWHAGRPRTSPHRVSMGTHLPLRKNGAVPPNFRAMSIVAKRLHGSRCHLVMEVGFGPDHIVLDGDPVPTPQKGGHSPQFSTRVCCGQTAVSIKMPRGTMVSIGPGNTVLHVDPAPPPSGTAPSQISVHVCCGQTAGWIKMSHGTKVGLGPGHIVLHGDPTAASKRGISAQSPIFGPCLLWPNDHPSQVLLSTCFKYDMHKFYFAN